VISCTEFIPAYSELFKFLHSVGGKAEVVRFWEELSDAFLGNLRDLAAEKGLAGCFEYWSRALTEEAADFRMTLDEGQGVFKIEMRRCPSMGRLLDSVDIEPYPEYCEHCDTLYRRVLEPLGFQYEIDLSEACRKAKCTITVQERNR
jgi:predicted ArsR family transcriptional regulator